MNEGQQDGRQVSFEEMELRAEQSKKKAEIFFTRLFTIAWDILSDRMLVLVSMAASAGMYYWAINDPTLLRFALCVMFSLTVFLPMLFLSLKRKRNG